MKKHIKIIAAVLALICALGVTVFAASYDSSEDPPVSLGFVLQLKDEILAEVEGKLDAFMQDILDSNISGSRVETETEAETEPFPEETTPVVQAPSMQYEVIELTNGDCLYAVSACDIILRAGTAVCIAPDASQGIADMTTAAEIYNAQALTKNHMCLIPRGDGRGVRATSESVFIMIRGDYTIVEG